MTVHLSTFMFLHRRDGPGVRCAYLLHRAPQEQRPLEKAWSWRQCPEIDSARRNCSILICALRCVPNFIPSILQKLDSGLTQHTFASMIVLRTPFARNMPNKTVGLTRGKHGRAAFQSVKIILRCSYLHAGDRVYGELPWLFIPSSCTRSAACPPVSSVHAGRY